MKREEVFTPGSFYSKGYTREQAIESVGSGWTSLVHEVFDKLLTIDTPVIIDQVKEKFGGLRIYTAPMHDEFDKIVIEIQRRSFTICETCGKPGAVRGRGWYYTSCDEHAKDGDLPLKDDDDAEEEN